MSSDTGAAAHALAYARRGWPVFPCRPGSKEPATPHGFKDATTDPERIAAWWRAAADRNVGIATGAPGPDVLDVDVRPRGSGYAAFRQLRQAGVAGDAFAIVVTPSGGLHAYYPGTGQRSGRLPAHHLDLKAVGGYVLAPPSHVGGRRYHVVQHQATGRCLDWAAAAHLLDPADRRPVAGQQRPGHSDADRLAAWVAVLEEGNRNAGLFWAACRLVEAGRPESLAALAGAARTSGLSDNEISRTLASARRTAATERPARNLPEHVAGVDIEAAS